MPIEYSLLLAIRPVIRPVKKVISGNVINISIYIIFSNNLESGSKNLRRLPLINS